MRTWDILAPTPPAGAPTLAVAACRAGACGVVDLELAHLAAPEAVHEFARLANTPFAVKLGHNAGAALDALLAQRPAPLRRVILAGGAHPQAGAWVRRLREAGLEVLWEAISVAEAEFGQQLGVDGLILKGHEAG